MRVLVTGAAGFVGSYLTKRLLQCGKEVVAVDNFSTGRIKNLEPCRGLPGFHFLEADCIDPLSVPGNLDWILHLASPASPPRYLEKPIETLRVNSEGTYNLLQLALEKKAQFLFASTSEIYGDPLIHPQPEGYWGNVNSIGSRSVYDEAKRFAEAMVMAYKRKHGLGIRLIRIFNTYGPGMDPEDGRVVSNMICQALSGQPITIYGDGKQTRSFQFVSDLVEGIFRLMETDYSGPVNLGNPEEYSMLALAEIVRELTKTDSPIQFRPLPEDDPKQRRPDISLAQDVLGWSPRVGVRAGLKETIRYFESELQVMSEHNSTGRPDLMNGEVVLSR